MIKRRKKFFIALSVLTVLIFIVAVTYLILNQDSRDNGLSYPGNGLPLISKNKPVDKINIEMQNYFGKYEFIKPNGNNLVFSNIPHSVKYQSSFSLDGPKTNFALDISLNAGKAIINIGCIEYEITPNESVINQGNKKIYSTKDIKVAIISIEKISDQAVARLWGNNMRLGDYVSLNFPAKISIELFENSSGEIGQWKWVRGFK